MPKTDKDARAHVAALGLNINAPGLDVIPVRPDRAVESPSKVVLAPEGVDPHSMPVSDIVFDPALLDDFPSLEGDGRADATRYVFRLYKSPHRDTDRHRRLQDEIGLFILRVRRSRETGTEHVKGKVKASKKQRDLLAYLAEHGVESLDDLAAILPQKGTS